MSEDQMYKEFTVIFFSPITLPSISKLWFTVEQCLDQFRCCKKMTLVLSSIGGNSHWAGVMSRYLPTLPIRIETHAVGSVSSSALLLYCLGEVRRADTLAYFAMHPSAYNIAEPGAYAAADLREILFQLQLQDDLLLQSLVSAMRKPRNTVENYVQCRTVFNASQAKENGLVTDIEALAINRSNPVYRISEDYSHLPSHSQPVVPPNNFFNPFGSPIFGTDRLRPIPKGEIQ